MLPVAGVAVLVFIGLLVGFGVVAGFVWLIVLMVRENQRRVDNLRTLAGRYQGTYTPPGFLSGGVTRVRLGDLEGALTCYSGSKNSPPYTRLEIAHGISGRLRVTPQGFFSQVRMLFGAEDLELGDAEFDPAFHIEAENATFARRVLTPEVRRLLLASRPWGPSLDVRHGRVTWRVGRDLSGRLDELDLFVARGARILEAILAREEGAIVVESLQQGAGATCPVCDGPMDDLVVRCAKCSTPHHVDCWDYLGSCATYACGGTQRRTA